MAELVDAGDLKSPGEIRKGSSPFGRIMTDKINPNHYKDFNSRGISSLQIAEAYELDIHLFSCLKYLLRAGLKDSEDTLTELKKAHWYLSRKIYLLDPSFDNPMPNDPYDERNSA